MSPTLRRVYERVTRSQYAINTASGCATSVFSALVMAVAYPLYIHYLGYERYGLWLTLTTVLTFAQLGNLGIAPALCKFVAEEYARAEFRAIQKYTATAAMTSLLAGACLALVVHLSGPPMISILHVSAANSQLALRLLPYVAILSGYTFFVEVATSALTGVGRLDEVSYLRLLSQLLNLSLAYCLLRAGFDLEALVLSNAASLLFLHGSSTLRIRKRVPIPVHKLSAFRFSALGRLLKLGFGIVGASFVTIALHPLNKLMLGHTTGLSTIPAYELSTVTAMKLRSFIESGLRALVPEVSRTNTSHQANAILKRISLQATLLAAIAGAAVFVGPLCIPAPLLKLWLGTAYQESLPHCLQISIIGAFLSLLGVPAYYIFIGLGRSGEVFLSTVVQSGCSLMVLVWLYERSSLTLSGALTAVSLGMTASTLFLVLKLITILRATRDATAAPEVRGLMRTAPYADHPASR